MKADQVTGQLTVGQLATRTGVRADTVRYYEREGVLRRHVAEIETEMARLATLRDDLLGMLAAMPGPGCPDPLPGTWCPSGLPLPEER
jgi:hypothetical protein